MPGSRHALALVILLLLPPALPAAETETRGTLVETIGMNGLSASHISISPGWTMRTQSS